VYSVQFIRTEMFSVWAARCGDTILIFAQSLVNSTDYRCSFIIFAYFRLVLNVPTGMRTAEEGRGNLTRNSVDCLHKTISFNEGKGKAIS
jgi:hypothetical protein